MKKIKIFLGGFVNSTNAQNLNCKAIAENLDKNKFEILALRTHFGNSEEFNYRTFVCIRPFRITHHLGFLWGFLKADILYLPKHIDTPLWVLRFANLFKKPIFTTIEGNVLAPSHQHNLIGVFHSKKKMQKHFSYFNETFAITRRLFYNANQVIKVSNTILPLGVDVNSFCYCNKINLSNIIFIGSLTKNKRIYEFIKLARIFPKLDFKIIGEGPERDYLFKLATSNVNFEGEVQHSQLKEFLRKSDLMFLPSKSEGFPKVILEAAASGVPIVVYNTYGASDWINNNEGFIVKNFQEVKFLVSRLINHPNLLQNVSKNVFNIAKRYDWKIIIDDWERVIENVLNEK